MIFVYHLANRVVERTIEALDRSIRRGFVSGYPLLVDIEQPTYICHQLTIDLSISIRQYGDWCPVSA